MPAGWRASSSHKSSTRSNFSANERSRSAGAGAELIGAGCGRPSSSQSPLPAPARTSAPRAFSVPPVCVQSASNPPAAAPRRLGEPDPSLLLRFSFDSPSIVPRWSRVSDPCSGRGVAERTPGQGLPGYTDPMSGGVGLSSISPAVGSMVPGRVAPVNVPLARVPRSYAAPQAPRLGFAGFDCLVTYRGGAPRLHQAASVRLVVRRALRARWCRGASPRHHRAPVPYTHLTLPTTLRG